MIYIWFKKFYPEGWVFKKKGGGVQFCTKSFQLIIYIYIYIYLKMRKKESYIIDVYNPFRSDLYPSSPVLMTEIQSLPKWIVSCVESNEDTNPKSGLIQSKHKPDYEPQTKPKAQKLIFDLIWPRFTKGAYAGYMTRTCPIYGVRIF